MKYPIREIFSSVQGEGLLVGSPCTFIRLAGCNVGCSFCDTPDALTTNGAMRLFVPDILFAIPEHTNHIVITGGEPTLQDLRPLTEELNKKGYFTQLETSGFNSLQGATFSHVTWSPKVAVNYEASPDVVSAAREIKLVIDQPVEPSLVDYIYHLLGLTDAPILLMPEGKMGETKFIPVVMEYLDIFARFPTRVRFGTRLHTILGVR